MIVGWNLSDTLDTGYVIQAVKDAVAAHGTPAILNSDQGCQFTSNAYKTLLKGLHIRQSMDGKSRWADNVMIERWFRSLKTEEIYLNEYPNPGLCARQSAYTFSSITPCAPIRRWNTRPPNPFTRAALHRRPLTLTVWSWLVERLRRGCGVG